LSEVGNFLNIFIPLILFVNILKYRSLIRCCLLFFYRFTLINCIIVILFMDTINVSSWKLYRYYGITCLRAKKSEEFQRIAYYKLLIIKVH
jgi:hypothetical protein